MAETTFSNPALVIGLGGTGQWVLTYIKNNLIDQFGAVPPQIRLLAFDTTSEDSEVYKDNEERSHEEMVRVGEIRLSPNTEFIYLGGNIKNVCEQIVGQNRYTHIGSWLQAENYLRTLSNDDFNLSRGAGQRRQFGRMAVFYDLISINKNKVAGKIAEALHHIVGLRKNSQPVDIYVIASIAGGTGSGMFIDIAHLARVLAEREVRTDITVRGFLVLPNTFQSVIRVDQVKASSYAAIRELDRFISTFGRDYPINYSDDPLARDLRTVYKSKLFDTCFLIDAERSQQTLSVSKPQDGVYPSISDCITMMIDPSAGDTFQQHYKNVSNEGINTQKRKGHAIYSSLGAFSYILPVRDIRQALALKFAQEFLEKEFIGSDITTGNNPLDKTINEQVIAFLQQPTSHSGIQNPPFIQGLSLLVREGDVHTSAYVQKVSARGRDLAQLLEPAGEDTASQQQKQRLRTLFNLSVRDDVPTSFELKNDDYGSASLRIPDQVDAFKRRYLGDASDQNGKRDLGELRQILASILDSNKRSFSELLSETSVTILNDSHNSLPGGRLSYLRTFLVQVIKHFDEFNTVIDSVRQLRNRDGQIAYAREDVRRAIDHLMQSGKKAGLLGTVLRKFSAKAEEDYAQEEYLRTEQYLIDLDLEDTLFTELINMSRALANIAQGMLADVNDWISVLASGNPSTQQTSVIRLLSDASIQLKGQRETKKHIKVHHYLSDDHYESQLYQEFTAGRREHLLERFGWRCRESNGEIKLDLLIDSKQVSAVNTNGQKSELVFQKFLAAVEPYFSDIEKVSVAERLQQLYSSKQLAAEMYNQSAPLINVQKEDSAAAHHEVQTFISMESERAVPFSSNTEAEIKQLVNSPKDAQLIAASDPHRCVIISTADLIGINAVHSLQDARKAYELQPDGAGQRRQLHNFPAEIHAVDYEKRLGEYPFFTKSARQYLSPRVVMVLENKERFELFMLSYAIGIIQLEDSLTDLRKQQYVMRLKRERRFDRTYALNLTEPDARPSLLDAVHTFVFRQPNKPDLELQNLVASVDGNLFVGEDRIKEAIRSFEDLIQWGLENQVRQFGRYLRGLRWSESMQPMIPVLESEYRYFLMENTDGQAHVSTPDDAMNTVQKWLSGLKDLKLGLPNDVIEKAAELLQTAKKVIREGKDQNRLRRRLEDVIVDKVPELQRSREQEDRDLGTLLHIIVWDYIQRLEQTEWQKN